MKEFSETFFHGNKNQEWFKDRYDPLKMQEQEADNVVWALKESVAFKKNLRGTLFAFIFNFDFIRNYYTINVCLICNI